MVGTIRASHFLETKEPSKKIFFSIKKKIFFPDFAYIHLGDHQTFVFMDHRNLLVMSGAEQ